MSVQPPPGETAPHPQPSETGDIPLGDTLTEEGTHHPSRERRWLESFGISLIPLIALVIAQVASSKVGLSLLNPVDVCFAMLATTAVLSVQLLESSKINPRADVVPSAIMLTIFAVAFTTIAVISAHDQSEKAASLDSAAISASSTLRKADNYIGSLPAPVNLKTYKMQIDMANSETTLAQDAKVAAQDETVLAPLVLALVVTILFLYLAYKIIWSKL